MQAMKVFMRSFFPIVLPMFCTAAAHGGNAKLVGVVTDYQPRALAKGGAAIQIKRSSGVAPVRELELIYEGDVFIFDAAAGPNTFVKALIDSKTEITLDRDHTTIAASGWPMLAQIFPRLVAASRWINSGGSSEHAEPRNAVSRSLEDVEDIAVAPNLRGRLIIWDHTGPPLWIGWTGGKPPFNVSATTDGALPVEVAVCKDVTDDACIREVEVQITSAGDGPITLTINDANGASWSKNVEHSAKPVEAGLAKDAELGTLGLFLRAAELLDKDQGAYTLESARKLAALSKTYPPARAILDNIRDGRVP